ncbi:hypothetical protein [Saccharomonospora xinjiangensis]|uniref:Uncharacterized protein n=1 Tax=Saccharomonospora xinjiangensis XJ-54 TaxID=882086 RepID=I0V3J1_9PSEU|nr:hypothetical protein [Saccharomonospora xinjiangensis]EID54694.1 hypothetical protein SacxiDRAFT_2471 [Saccharomonospora xinjiangensis XJ-54]
MVDEGLPKDGFAVPLRLHNVLLALAGRLDDSALSEARELVARSHLDDAAELAVGALIAGRIMVRPSEQRELALVLEMSRSDAALADQLTVGESVPGYTHRFSRDNDPDAGIAEALDRTLQVLPDVRSVHAVWRNTPAGSVPGPLPQRVVLIEIGPEAHPPAVAFRVDDALRRSGIRAVVEVTGPSAERTDYHEAALATATPAWLASGQGAGDTGGRKSRSRSSRKITAGAARARSESESESARHASHDAYTAPERFEQQERFEQPRQEEQYEQYEQYERFQSPRQEEHERFQSSRQDEPVQPIEQRWSEPPAVAPHDPAEFPEAGDEQANAAAPVVEAGQPAASSSTDPAVEVSATDVPAVEAAPADLASEAPAVEAQVVEAQVVEAQVTEEPWPEPRVEPSSRAEKPEKSDKSEKPSFSADELAELENRVAETTEMSPEEVAQLRAAIAEDYEKGREIAGLSASMVELPELALDDPQLSERDRQLLRELHAELAERERAEATRTNGAELPWGEGSKG